MEAVSSSRLEAAIKKIDAANAEDPHQEWWQDDHYPKELLYAQRMTQQLFQLTPAPSEELQLAVRGQHICRWQIPRADFPMDRIGYIKWRNTLKNHHSEKTAAILQEVGYPADFIERVSFLIEKRQLKKDAETQALEDTACLIFLQYYMPDFAAKNEEEKLIDILRKTWNKMSAKAQQLALQIDFPEKYQQLIQKAL